MASDRTPSLLEVAVSNVGLIRSGGVIVGVVAWAMAMERDDWPQDDDAKGVLTDRVEIWADVLAIRERSAWRKLEQFRRAFPGEHDPGRLAKLIQSQDVDRAALVPYVAAT